MGRDASSAIAQAHSVFVRLVLPPYTIHFKSATYMRDATLEMLDKKVCKETLKSTAQNVRVREAIGGDAKFWTELVVLFKAAIPSLERRSFTIWDPSSVDYESTSGALIASHYPALWKDLERLNDLVSISRNVLTIGEKAQDLAAEYGVDIEVFRLINCCVRVTARGYDGEAGTGDEEKWQWIVNAYKKLLITSLQFLNNAVAQNERRKLMLWVSLFDQTGSSEASVPDVRVPGDENATVLGENRQAEKIYRPRPPVDKYDMLISYGTNGRETLDLEGAESLWDDEPFSNWPPPAELLQGRERMEGNGYSYFHIFTKQFQFEDYATEHGRDPTEAEQYLEMPRRWGELREPDRQEWQKRYDEALAKYKQDLAVYEAKLLLSQPVEKVRQAERELSSLPVSQQAKAVERKIAALEESLAERYRAESTSKMNGNAPPFWIPNVAPLEPASYGRDGALTFPSLSADQVGLGGVRDHGSVTQDDMKMLFTAEAGAKILESGKAELMKRLEGYEAPPNADGDVEGAVSGGRTRSLSLTTQHTRNVSQQRTLDRRRSSAQNSAAPASTSAVDEDDEEQDLEDEEADEEEEIEDESEEGDEDEDEEEEEDYPGSTEDGRGLLTDVPLILGPSEIEVLPMLIMSGIVPPNQTSSPPSQAPPPTPDTQESGSNNSAYNALTNLHTIRTHLLLSQSNGRNLLRELLIFVAAWDLREEELYFKFMVKILEAILKGGLMPYAYHAFRDRSRSKDIISPAQAVVMKLLTVIFRTRANGEGGKVPSAKDMTQPQQLQQQPPLIYPPPSCTDLHILSFIFTEFRQHIIPQTCALIFLQGQIRVGRASPEDFPLNLWDMERMYEGVYQYLEFFAVLSEEGVWKGVLGGWEMASELVTLLRELEGGVGKGLQSVRSEAWIAPGAKRATGHGLRRSLSADAAIPGAPVGQGRPLISSTPAAVERLLDAAVGSNPGNGQEIPGPEALISLSGTGRTSGNGERVFEAETPLAWPEDGGAHSHAQQSAGHSNAPPAHQPQNWSGSNTTANHLPLSTSSHATTQPPNPSSSTHAPGLTPDQDEPSAFEWRNLKKLTVLVLSSLIWRNPLVQRQVREYGGLEALVGCCRVDEHNPYIREHAIMCLRFAVEGCEENGRVVREMAEKGALVGARRAAGTGGGVEGGSVTLDPSSTATTTTARRMPPAAVDLSVPREVLDANGYETFMDTKGQVGLRRKDIHTAAAPSMPSASSSKQRQQQPPSLYSSLSAAHLAATTKLTAEKAAELMQNALRELPLGDKLVTEQQKREALAKLDRAFESTEVALGRAVGRKAGGGAGGA